MGNTTWTGGYKVLINHHVSTASIPFQRVLQPKIHYGFPFPLFKPMIAMDSAIVLIYFPITCFPLELMLFTKIRYRNFLQQMLPSDNYFLICCIVVRFLLIFFSCLSYQIKNISIQGKFQFTLNQYKIANGKLYIPKTI